MVTAVVAAVLVAPSLGPSLGTAPEAELDTVTLADWTRDGDWLVSDPIDAPTTVLVGASWAVPDAQVEMRAADGGAWGAWVDFHADHDHAPDGDPGHAPGDAAGPDEVLTTDPIWIGASSAFQVRVRTVATDPVVTLETVRMSGGDGRAYVAEAGRRGMAIASDLPPGAPPEVVPRSSWDPDGECRVRGDLDVGDGYRMAHVHHTVMYPRYAADEGPDVVRALCLFHTEARGWSDLGYNFLVDRYGRVYEGRAGSLAQPVAGAHAAGFNHVSVGVTAIGDFETDEVPQVTVDAIERLIAWQFAVYRIDPRGGAVVESTGGDNPALTRFAAGEAVDLPVIVGHRDTGSDTLCPGRFLYAALDGAAERVTGLMVAAGHDLDAFAVEPEPEAEPVPADASGDDATDAEPPVVASGAVPPALPTTGLGFAALALLALAVAAGLAAVRDRYEAAAAVTSGGSPRPRRAPSTAWRRRRPSA